VADGDTITMLDSNRQQHRIRLAGIDAPEKAQPFGQRSKQHLAQLAFGKDAKADCYKGDRYDRDVCTVYVNGKDVGLAQLDAGLARWFRKYAHEQLPKDRIDYEAAESRAAADRIGL
jgi:endonuclease YncB( thermonuclease family)